MTYAVPMSSSLQMVWVLTVALAFFLGFFLALGVGLAIGRRRSGPESVGAVCPCGDTINFHEKLTGACAATERVPVRWDTYHRPYEWAELKCDCQAYAGPELISTMTMRPIVQHHESDQ